MRPFLAFLCKGDWHQYDDIICVQPTSMQQFTKSIKTFFGSEQRDALIKGRQIAGTVMLETIFELVKSWTDVNLKNFWLQLRQFFEVYSKPFVYEEKEERWLSLDYGENDVSAAKLAQFSRPCRDTQVNEQILSFSR